MNKLVRPSGIARKRFLAAAATIALSSAVGYGVIATTTPVFADPVFVTTTQNVPSFADLVAKVSPAVVSVRVESRVQPASDDGTDFFSGPGWDQLGSRTSGEDLGKLLGELKRYAPDPLPRAWPSDPTLLSSHLKRLLPALRASGVDVDVRRTNRAREVVLTKLGQQLEVQP